MRNRNSDRRTLFEIAAVVALVAAAPAALGQRIDPRVLQRAQSEPVIPVFIVLEHQPQREILDRVEGANALHRQVAESRYRQAAERGLPEAEELRQGREAAEAVLLRTRQQAFQAIEQAVGPEQDALESRLRGLGAARISRYLGINMLTAEIPASAVAALEADPAIAQVFPVEKDHAQLATSVPEIGALAFWNAGYTGQGESVGVLDSGVRTNHPAFAGVSIVSQVFLANGSQSQCFADDASSAEDRQGHGTHVSGIVVSQGSAGWTNYQGVAKGIGTLYNLKVGYRALDSETCGQGLAEADHRDVLAALDWAIANTPLRIFNYSYGGTASGDDDGFTRSIDQYIDTYGLVFAISAGNGYGVTSPGIGYNGITVANWVTRGVVNGGSSRGPTQGNRYKPDLAAPGTNIYSAAYDWDAVAGTGDDFVAKTGTSMAAPHIAGAAALLENAGVTDPLAVKAILIDSADTPGYWMNDSGWGYTNLNTALGQLNYASGALARGGIRFYKASVSGNLRATIAWNRHVSRATSSFNDLSFYLYQADTGAELAYSYQPGQNVQMVSATYTGDAVLAVEMSSQRVAGVDSEPFALASSSPIQPAAGAHLGVSCHVPSPLPSGGQFRLTCDVSNSGDLPALGTLLLALAPDGFSGSGQTLIGDLAPGTATTAYLDLIASKVEGTYAIIWQVFASTFRPSTSVAGGSETTSVQLALPPPVLTWPADGATEVTSMPTLTWNASPGATAYDVYIGASWPPPLRVTTTQTSYTAVLLPGIPYYWQVVARSGAGASSSALWSLTTTAATFGQPQEYVVGTVAGGGFGQDSCYGCPATSASLFRPNSVAVDASGNLYIADDSRTYKVTPDGIIRIVPSGQSIAVAVDTAGNLYVVPDAGFRVYKVTPDNTVTTVAGTGTWGYSGDGGPATSAQIVVNRVTVDAAGNLYIADDYNNIIRKVSVSGVVTTVAGNGTVGYSGDGGPAISAQFNQPLGMAVDASGSLYIADHGNSRIRKLTPDGSITTAAGNGVCDWSGDNGPATNASLCSPQDVAVDAAGNLLIADSGNGRVRKVAPNGTITTIAGSGWSGYWGDGAPATGTQLATAAVAVDSAGKIYVADGTSRVRVLIPADVSCQRRLPQTVFALPPGGGTIAVPIQTGPACWWEVSSLPGWIVGQILGKGPAMVNLTATPNPGPLRAAAILIAGTAVTITEGDGTCAYSLGAAGASPLPGGGTGSIAVTASPGCPWTASSSVDWVTLGGSTSGIGSGTVSYTVARNGGGTRSGAVTVAGLTFTVQQSGPPANGLRFVPVTPCRAVDTRHAGPTMAANSTRSFAIPQSGCGIPAPAQAYSLNVTVVPQGPLSYLTLWPTGQAQPLVSTLNSFGGIVVANAAIVPAGIDGAVSVYVTNPTDVILDVDGYFDSPGSYAFYPAQPCRVADTRNPAGPFGGPSLSGAQSRDFPVPSSACGLPSTASAYSMNVTVVPQGYLGYLTTWPTSQAQPNVSTLNSWTGKVVANAAIVPAGAGGSISVYAQDPTDVILDTNGYFGAPGGNGALNFYPVAPCRVADTRGDDGPFGGPEMEAATTRSFPIPSSACGIPSTAAACSVNVTVVPDGPLSYLTTWPTGSAQPIVSTLNSWDGAVVANAAIVPAGVSGAISVYVTNRTHVILDINGYFAP